MSLDDRCPRCSSLMLTAGYSDDPMYCIVCGAQGDTPPTNNVHGSRANKARGSTAHTARYKAVLRKTTMDWQDFHEELQHLIVRYKLTYADRPLSVMPALIMECPWCKGVTRSQTWKSNRREHVMHIECPSKHYYTMVFSEEGDYYWR